MNKLPIDAEDRRALLYAALFILAATTVIAWATAMVMMVRALWAL